MTGTTLEVELAMAFTEYVPNKALGAIASEAMQEVGAPQWDEADFQLARQFLESYDPETRSAVEAEIRRTYGDRAEAVLQRPLATDVIPFDPAHIRLQAGSTDVGDVGYAAPTLNLLVATACVGNVGHSWQMTAQACSPLHTRGCSPLPRPWRSPLCAPCTAPRPLPLPRQRCWPATAASTPARCPIRSSHLWIPIDADRTGSSFLSLSRPI